MIDDKRKWLRLCLYLQHCKRKVLVLYFAAFLLSVVVSCILYYFHFSFSIKFFFYQTIIILKKAFYFLWSFLFLLVALSFVADQWSGKAICSLVEVYSHSNTWPFAASLRTITVTEGKWCRGSIFFFSFWYGSEYPRSNFEVLRLTFSLVEP